MKGILYRYDIDGLRFLAVAFVILFHFNENLLPGGYIGVDVFFTISGFLITSINWRLLKENKFSFSNFYRRRIQRLFPLAFFVIFIVALVSYFTVTSEEIEFTFDSAIYSLLSIPNYFFLFYLENGYFEEHGRYIPLLHFWSLGVEEQYYLVYPLLLFILLKINLHIKFVLIALVIFILSSLAYSESLLQYSDFSVSISYFSLPSRFFQLLIGGFLAILVIEYPSKFRSYIFMTILGVAGLSILLLSSFLLSSAYLYPGVNGILPVCGTLFVICSGLHKSIISKILSLKIFSFLGKISYSLYLWHWPVIVWLNYFQISDIYFSKFLLYISITFILSIITYYLIENKFRYTKLTTLKVVWIYLILPIFSAIIIFQILRNHRVKEFFHGKDEMASQEEYYFFTKHVNTSNFKCDELLPPNNYENWCLSRDTEKSSKSLLIGDSNAMHFVGFLSNLYYDYSLDLDYKFKTACAPLISVDNIVRSDRVKSCSDFNAKIFNNIEQYDIIILAGQWINYITDDESIRVLKSTIDYLIKENKKIILMPQIPILKTYNKNCIQNNSFAECSNKSKIINKGEYKCNKILESISKENSSVFLIKVRNLLCSDSHCSPYLLSGIYDYPIYFNYSHLGLGGSWALSEDYKLNNTNFTDLTNFIKSNMIDRKVTRKI